MRERVFRETRTRLRLTVNRRDAKSARRWQRQIAHHMTVLAVSAAEIPAADFLRQRA